jgi:hypothetical protein
MHFEALFAAIGVRLHVLDLREVLTFRCHPDLQKLRNVFGIPYFLSRNALDAALGVGSGRKDASIPEKLLDGNEIGVLRSPFRQGEPKNAVALRSNRYALNFDVGWTFRS